MIKFLALLIILFGIAFIMWGCGPAVITALEVTASSASLANNVLGIDVSLQQDSKTKSPILTWIRDHLP